MDNIDLLVTVILNNTRLSYTDENKLMIDDDKAIMEIVKALEKRDYEIRVDHLKELKENGKE